MIRIYNLSARHNSKQKSPNRGTILTVKKEPFAQSEQHPHPPMWRLVSVLAHTPNSGSSKPQPDGAHACFLVISAAERLTG